MVGAVKAVQNQGVSNGDDLARLHKELVSALEDVRSSKALERHPKYRADRLLIDQILRTPEYFETPSPSASTNQKFLRIAAWNIERGLNFDRICETIKTHPELSKVDIFLLSEVDYGMARSGNRHIAQELGKALNLHSLFGPAYIALDKGNSAEKKISTVHDNTAALHGNAILSRYPLRDLELIKVPNPKDFMNEEERKIGYETAILATAETPLGPVHVGCVHLSAHSTRGHRLRQLRPILEKAKNRVGPMIFGGDFNTSTYNSNRATWAILGFWRRVAIAMIRGHQHVMKNIYAAPERSFERNLFQEIANFGFDVNSFNILGGCTFHYDFTDEFMRLSLGDWVPDWCFPFIQWALRESNGRCSLKLDWFAGRGLKSERNQIIQDLPRGFDRASDHDPILSDVRPE